MSHRNLLTAALILLAAGLCATRSAEPTGDEIVKIVTEVARGAAKEAKLEMLSVLVAVDGEVLVDSSFGRAPDGKDSPHRIGSLLPQFIATGVLQLADQDKLSLEDELTKYFPDLANAKEVRVRHLLTHTSGLPDFSGFVKGNGAIAPEQVVEWLKNQSLEHQPDHCAKFSLSNIALAGALVEKVGETTLEEYLTKWVFEPTEMSSTHWCWDEPQVNELEPCNIDLPGGWVETPDLPRLFAAAGLCSTAADLQRWQQALVSRTLLEDDSFVTFTSPRRLAEGERSSIAGGACAVRLGQVEGFASGGEIGGFTTSLAFYPDYDLGVILLARGNDADLRRLERRISRAVLDLPDPEIRDLPLNAEEKAPYLGAYYIGCSQVMIENAEAGERLMATWPDGTRFDLYYQGRHVFASAEDDEVSLIFTVEDGRATKFDLYEHGAVTEAKRLD